MRRRILSALPDHHASTDVDHATEGDLPEDYDRALREVQNLRVALASRTTIATAVGILVERNRWTSEHAFDWLVRLSQTTNTRVRILAADLVDEATSRADRDYTDAQPSSMTAPRWP